MGCIFENIDIIILLLEILVSGNKNNKNFLNPNQNCGKWLLKLCEIISIVVFKYIREVFM